MSAYYVVIRERNKAKEMSLGIFLGVITGPNVKHSFDEQKYYPFEYQDLA